MKPPLRTKSVGTKVSEAEFALLEERARGTGMRSHFGLSIKAKPAAVRGRSFGA